MSRSRRGSNRNRNNANASGGNGSGNGNGNQAGRGGGGPKDFWGSVVPNADEPAVLDTPDPTAMVRSLGPPPLAGNRPISEHYFTAVYGKAAGLANALLATDRPVPPADDLVG